MKIAIIKDILKKDYSSDSNSNYDEDENDKEDFKDEITNIIKKLIIEKSNKSSDNKKQLLLKTIEHHKTIIYNDKNEKMKFSKFINRNIKDNNMSYKKFEENLAKKLKEYKTEITNRSL